MKWCTSATFAIFWVWSIQIGCSSVRSVWTANIAQYNKLNNISIVQFTKKQLLRFLVLLSMHISRSLQWPKPLYIWESLTISGSLVYIVYVMQHESWVPLMFFKCSDFSLCANFHGLYANFEIHTSFRS